MVKNRIRQDCLKADELMRVIREKVDSDREEAMSAFGELYDIYKGVLWGLCVKVCGDNATADLVYERTWKNIQNHPDYDYLKYNVSFETWMSRIAHNAWRDVMKKSVPVADDTIDDIIASEVGIEEEEREPSANARLIDKAMAELTEREREILKIYLTYDTDKKLHVPQDVLDELQKRYQTTPANLRKIKSRALEKVRDYVRKHQ